MDPRRRALVINRRVLRAIDFLAEAIIAESIIDRVILYSAVLITIGPHFVARRRQKSFLVGFRLSFSATMLKTLCIRYFNRAIALFLP